MGRMAIQEFERAFTDYQGAVAARGFWMGRIGLYAALKALGVGPGKRVGVCSFTCLGVIEPVVRLGATPVYLDVDDHLNIAPAALLRLDQPLSALVLQHTFGVPCDLDASLAWARERGVPVIEDCCHALGASWRGQRVGTFGLAGVFSFQWGKSFSTGQGGMLTLNDASLAREVDAVVAGEASEPTLKQAALLAAQRPLYRFLVTPRTRRTLRRLHGWLEARGVVSGSEPEGEDLSHAPPGFLRRCAPSQAAAGTEQLRRWPEAMRARQAAAAAALAALRRAGATAAAVDARATPVHLRVPLRVRDKPRALAEADAAAIDIAGWYASPAHPLEGAALAALGYRSGDCPAAEQAFAQGVTLPTRPALSSRALDAAMRIVQNSM